jgi:hypothetical protein
MPEASCAFLQAAADPHALFEFEKMSQALTFSCQEIMLSKPGRQTLPEVEPFMFHVLLVVFTASGPCSPSITVVGGDGGG